MAGTSCQAGMTLGQRQFGLDPHHWPTGKSPISHYYFCHSLSTHCKSFWKASLCTRTSYDVGGGTESTRASAQLCSPHSKLSFTICSGVRRNAWRSSNTTTLLIDKNTSVRNLPATDRLYRRNISILAQLQIISTGLLTNRIVVAEFSPRIIFKQAAWTLVLMLLCGL